MTSASSKPVITLDQLVALNDEIAALVRAGVPLDRGLRSLGEDLPGRLGRFATQLSERIARGESLTDALAEPTSKLPRLYRAVIEAGIAAGRLPAALESLAGSLRRLAETRRSVVLSLTYPLLLFLLAWGLFAFSASMLAPAVYHSFQELHLPGGEWFRPVARLGPVGPDLGTAGPRGPAGRWPGCGGWGRKARRWRRASARLGSSAGFRGWVECCDFRGRPSSSRSSSCWSRIACRWTRPSRWPQRPPVMRH